MRSKLSKVACHLQLFLILSLLAVSEPVFAQASDEAGMRKAKEHFAAGREFIRQGNYSAADNEFKKAQLLLGASASAIKKVEPKPALVQPGAPKEVKNAKKEELAKDPLSFYAKAIKAEPKNADLYFNLGLEYIKINEYKLAEEVLKRAIQLNPRDKEASYNLGVLYEIYLNMKAQALYYYSRYVGLAPREDDAWRVRVWIKDLKVQLADEKQ